MSLSRGTFKKLNTREAISFPPLEPPGSLLPGGSLYTETFKEKMARQEKQLKSGELLLSQGKKALSVGREILSKS